MGNKPYSDIKCPECDNKGDFTRDDHEEVYCLNCGLVIESPYPFCAGMKFKTLEDILLDKEIERINKARWRREND